MILERSLCLCAEIKKVFDAHKQLVRFAVLVEVNFTTSRAALRFLYKPSPVR